MFSGVFMHLKSLLCGTNPFEQSLSSGFIQQCGFVVSRWLPQASGGSCKLYTFRIRFYLPWSTSVGAESTLVCNLTRRMLSFMCIRVEHVQELIESQSRLSQDEDRRAWRVPFQLHSSHTSRGLQDYGRVKGLVRTQMVLRSKLTKFEYVCPMKSDFARYMLHGFLVGGGGATARFLNYLRDRFRKETKPQAVQTTQARSFCPTVTTKRLVLCFPLVTFGLAGGWQQGHWVKQPGVWRQVPAKSLMHGQ